MADDIFDSAIYRPTGGFMGMRNTYDLEGARLAVLGMPFDCGVHPTRVGSRMGPAAIREQSGLVRPFQPPHADFNPLEELGAVDCGDAVCFPGRPEPSFEVMEEAVYRIASRGVATLTMGGDGTVTLPQLRAWRRVHDDLCVLHIDAHTDTYPITGQERVTTATTFTLAAEEGLIDAGNTLHIGARGPTYMGGVFEFTREQGYELIPDADMRREGLMATMAHAKARLAGRKVYLCWDMDVFDPSCAPGVCTPTWGGLTAGEGLAMLQSLAGLDIVAVDVNTVSPPHDVGGMTAFLAGCVMLEGMTLVARRGDP
jgi:agmatinase